MKSILLTFVSLIVLVGSITAQDEVKSSPVKFLVELGIEYGGDDLIEVQFTNGGSQTMKAGQGGFIAAGAEISLGEDVPILFTGTIGIKYNTTAAENANIRLTRLPVNLLAHYRIDSDFRIGAGISTHLGVSFKGDDFFPDTDFTSTVGPRIELGWRWLALTYTAVNYENEIGDAINASSVGVTASFTIPN